MQDNALQKFPLLEIKGKKYLSPEMQRRTLAYMFGRTSLDTDKQEKQMPKNKE